ncbi:MAG: RidA family protein [Alphaproteobacteria bacterium]|nr:RidA family protein [Alphaproteobacteria bacterium]
MHQSDVVIPKGMETAWDRFHYAPAVKAGDLLLCSGVIGVGPDRKPSPDPEAQFTLAFERVGSVLAAAGVTFADVVEMTTYHVGLQAQMESFLKVKDRFLAAPYPAWTAIGIAELAIPGALVEIRVIARLRRA